MKRAYPGDAYASDEENWGSGDKDLAMFGLAGDGTGIAASVTPNRRSFENAATSPSKKLRVSNRAKHLVK